MGLQIPLKPLLSCGTIRLARSPCAALLGGVVEWLMAPVLKTGEVKASVGSNPTPSVDRLMSMPKSLVARQWISALLRHSAAYIPSDAGCDAYRFLFLVVIRGDSSPAPRERLIMTITPTAGVPSEQDAVEQEVGSLEHWDAPEWYDDAALSGGSASSGDGPQQGW